jgi:hypothetical protein
VKSSKTKAVWMAKTEITMYERLNIARISPASPVQHQRFPAWQ